MTLIIVGFLLSLATACGKVDRDKRNFIACSQQIIEFSKSLDPKTESYSEQFRQKVLETAKRQNFQGIPQLQTAYEKYIKYSDPRLGEILQKIENDRSQNTRPGKISNQIPPGKLPAPRIDRVLEEQTRQKTEDEKSFLIGCERGDKGRVLYFLDKGVDINARDEKTGRTGLHYAVEGFYTEIVLLLLSRGADPNIRSFNGFTPVLLPGKMEVYHPNQVLKHTELLDLLFNAGANVNDQTGKEGLSVLDLYFLNSKSDEILGIAIYLLEKGADVNTRTISDTEIGKQFIPAGSTLLDVMTALDKDRFTGFLMHHGAVHGIWAKYYLGGKEKEDFLKIQEPPPQQSEPGLGFDRSMDQSQRDKKSPSEVVIAAYTAANKGNYAETEQYIHSGFLAGIRDANPAQALKKRWDKVTRDKKIKKVEILGQEIQKERAAVYFKIYFKDGKVKVAKEQLVKEKGHWKVAAE